MMVQLLPRYSGRSHCHCYVRFFVYVVITSLIGGLQLFDVPQILTNGTGDPMRSTMTLIMFLNKHLYSKNYGMAGALSVVLFIITGILSLVVFKITGNDKRKG